MTHLTQEQLVTRFYADSAEDSAALDQHIEACGLCRSSYEQLSAVLNSIQLEVPERSSGYEAAVWHNLRAHLPEPERTTARWWAWRPHLWAATAAVLALVIASFFLGRVTHTPPDQVVQAPSAPPVVAQSEEEQAPVETASPERRATTAKPAPVKDGGRDRILLVALGDHLDRSQMVLVELMNARPDESLDISSQQRLVEDLVSANRLYRQTAARAKDKGVVSLLDELERVLLDIAHEPSKLSGPELQEIRERIEAQGIVFKVRVVGSQVKQRRQQRGEATNTQKVQRG